MAILILKHNALTPYSDFEGAKNGIIEKMETAQQGELWAAEYFTASDEGVENTKGAVLAFKGKNGIITFTDGNQMSEEMKQQLSEYYTKDEVDELLNTKLADYYTKSEVDTALDTKIGKEDVMLTVYKKIKSSYTINAQNPSTPHILSGSEWSIQITSDRAYISFDVVNSKDEIVLEWQGVDSYLPISQLTHKNGILSADIEIGPGGAQEIAIDPSESYKVVYNTDRNDNEVHQFYIKLEVESNGSETFNTKQSFEYIDNIKANKSEVETAVAELETSLDTKIGRDDIMLSLGVTESTYSLNVMGSNVFTPYVSGNNWKITVTGRGSSYFLSKEGQPQFMSFGSTAENPTWIYTHNNGTLTVESGNQPSIYQIDSNASYRISHEDGSTIEVVIESSSELNTKDSILYLNDSKADKVEVENLVNNTISNLSSDLTNHITNEELHLQEGERNKWNKAKEDIDLFLDANAIKDDTINTLKEIQDYISEDAEAAAQMVSNINSKIGKDDEMINLGTFNETQIFNDSFDTSLRDLGENWEAIININNSNPGGVFIGGIDVTTPPFSGIKISCVNNIVSVYQGDNLMGSVEYNGNLGIMFVDPVSGEIVITKKNSLNTQDSFTYLNSAKADKSDVEVSLNSKVGKYDTVLSINDGETKTDYNVEGALDYLNNEIQAMSVIDCGVF